MSYGEVVTDSGTRPMTEAELRIRIEDVRQEYAALIRILYGPHTGDIPSWMREGGRP